MVSEMSSAQIIFLSFLLLRRTFSWPSCVFGTVLTTCSHVSQHVQLSALSLHAPFHVGSQMLRIRLAFCADVLGGSQLGT